MPFIRSILLSAGMMRSLAEEIDAYGFPSPTVGDDLRWQQVEIKRLHA